MVEQKEGVAPLETSLTLEKKNGVKITVTTVCGGWKNVEKFLNQFEDTLLKGNNERLKHQHKTEP